jgi:hypothetical protein
MNTRILNRNLKKMCYRGHLWGLQTLRKNYLINIRITFQNNKLFPHRMIATEVSASKKQKEIIRVKEIMKSLGKYVGKKKLKVNVEKTKMVVFSERKRKSEWVELGKKENITSKRVQILGLHIQWKSHISERQWGKQIGQWDVFEE